MTTADAARIRVAAIDDERSLREMLQLGLTREGFEVQTAVDAVRGLELVRTWSPQCIVLDMMMPKLDGVSAIPLLRRLTEAPILMLTARGEVRDRIAGIEAGADDYIGKPFDIGELASRIRAAVRRPALAHVTSLRYADLEVELESREVRRGSRRIALSAREFDLLVTLLRRPTRVFTRDELLDLVWGPDRDVTTNTVETYIHYLRAKVDEGEAVRLIRTMRGVGYALRETP